MSTFTCDLCGCSSFKPPERLDHDEKVHCFSCGTPVGTWGELKDVAVRLIALEQSSGKRPHLSWASSDPLPVGPIVVHKWIE